MSANNMFNNHCGWCSKSIGSYAINKQGDLPLVFCGSPCETKYNQNKKFVGKKVTAEFKKGLTTEQLAEKMSKAHWANEEYVTEELPI